MKYELENEQPRFLPGCTCTTEGDFKEISANKMELSITENNVSPGKTLLVSESIKVEGASICRSFNLLFLPDVSF